MDSIDAGTCALAQNENAVKCPSCGSPLFYVRKTWGVVKEMWEWNVQAFENHRKNIKHDHISTGP